MSRASITLDRKSRRQQAANWCWTAPDGARVTFQEAKRTTPQNDLMWDLLTDIAKQLPWHGQKLSADDFKLIFMAALNTELRIVPNLDGTGFVPLGRSSSKLSKSEMSNLIELILAFGAQHGVTFFDSDQSEGVPNKAPSVVA